MVNPDDLELYLQADFLLLPGHKACVRSNFHIARYPVSVRDYRELVEKATDISADDRKLVKSATWRETIRYCNLLSRLFNLPTAYDGNGYLINPWRQPVRDIAEVGGFRLPTPQEWDYAACGGFREGKTDDGREGLANRYYQEMASGKTPVLDELEENTIGLRGMIGNVQEWCSDPDYGNETRNPICGWTYYYSNYDVMSYTVATDFLNRRDPETERCRFRPVFMRPVA
jgi:formylglycine-generating enzyme required for sulfatase activity